MTGGWPYIVAGYVVAAVVLTAYSLSLVARLRKARQAKTD